MNREQYQAIFKGQTLSDLPVSVYELSWLLSRDYAIESSLKLVGDRYRLHQISRKALKRAACSDHSLAQRRAHEILPVALKGREVWVDGFNLLITIERALRGDPILICRDGVLRDIAGVHGSYRCGERTPQAFELITDLLKASAVKKVKWLFDRPVSNSGRAAQMARTYGEAEVVSDPDQDLMQAREVVVLSGDGVILERCEQWVNLTSLILQKLTHEMKMNTQTPWVIDLSSA